MNNDIHYYFYKELLTRLADLEKNSTSKAELNQKLNDLRSELESKLNTKVDNTVFNTFKEIVTSNFNNVNSSITTINNQLNTEHEILQTLASEGYWVIPTGDESENEEPSEIKEGE